MSDADEGNILKVFDLFGTGRIGEIIHSSVSDKVSQPCVYDLHVLQIFLNTKLIVFAKNNYGLVCNLT